MVGKAPLTGRRIRLYQQRPDDLFDQFGVLVGRPPALVDEAQEDRLVGADGEQDRRRLLDVQVGLEQPGKAYSLVVVEDEASGARVREALAERPTERRVGVDPDHVQFLTAIPF
jgi:hypothetical protein